MKLIPIASIVLLVSMISIPGSSMAAQSPEALSGEYRLHFEQISKSCGAKIAPVDVRVAIIFSDSHIKMNFPSGFLGFNLLNAKFDPKTATFNDQLKQRVSLGSVWADLSLTIKGKLINQDQNTEILYEVLFDKNADDPDWNCKVTGKGRATKI